MCSIFTVSSNPSLVGKYFSQQIQGDTQRKSNNVRISEETMIITADEPHVIQYACFGLIPSTSLEFKMERSTFNARKENILSSRLWAPLFYGHKRCLVIADGFTEPEKTPKGTQHWRFTVPGQELITFAGLWDEWLDRSTGDRFKSFSVITVPANIQVAEVHAAQRMPAILDIMERDIWLSKQKTNEEYLNVLQTWPDDRMEKDAYDPFNKLPKMPPPDDLRLF